MSPAEDSHIKPASQTAKILLILEPICVGLEHAAFNASFLSICAETEQNKIIFCAEENHLLEVRRLFYSTSQTQIEWISVQTAPRQGSLTDRFFVDRKLMSQIYRFTSPFEEVTVVLASFSNAVIWALKTSKLYWHRSFCIFLVAHSSLNQISGWRSRNPFLGVLGLKSSMLFAPKNNIKYVLLEESIARALTRRMPSIASSIVVFPHPIPVWSSKISSSHKYRENGKIRIGFLGTATKKKGFFEFIEFAKNLTDQFGEVFEFWCIGQVRKEDWVSEIKVLQRGPWQQKVDLSTYIDCASELDFVCIFHKTDHYSLSPSGVLLDALALQKPIIHYNLDLIKDIESHSGQVGLNLNNSNTYKEIAFSIIGITTKEYEMWKLNMAKEVVRRTSFSLQYIFARNEHEIE